MTPFATHNLLNVVLVALFAASGEEDAEWAKCQFFCRQRMLEEFKRQQAMLILLAEFVLDVFYNGVCGMWE